MIQRRIEELQWIEGTKERAKKKGLLAAIGAWDDFEDLEHTVLDIYAQRKESTDRSPGGLV